MLVKGELENMTYLVIDMQITYLGLDFKNNVTSLAEKYQDIVFKD